MYEIIFTESYEKCAVKFFKKHPELVDRYKKILYLLKSKPYHPSLRLNKLKGNLKDFYSVSIDLEYRIILHFIIQDKTIIPIDIGKHDDVY